MNEVLVLNVISMNDSVDTNGGTWVPVSMNGRVDAYGSTYM